MKKIFLFAIVILIFAGCTARVRDGGEVVLYQRDENAPPVVSIQNDYLRLEFLTETAEIILYELGTDNVWRSTPENITDAPGTAAIERFFAQSLFVLTFEQRTGSEQPYDSYRYSVRNDSFRHEIINDALELRFTVGDVIRTFQIPDAIYEDRLLSFLNTLPREDRMYTLGFFQAVSLARPGQGQTRDTVLQRFPMLDGQGERTVVMVLRDTTSEEHRERIEEHLRNAGYTHDDWESDMGYFNVPTEISTAAFNLIMRFELDRNNMVVTVPMNEINYVPEFMPTALTVMPYFGAGRATDEGYLFVPDGSGSLMYFDSARNTQSLFASYMFGWDEAIVRDAVLHDNRAAFPVFGIYRNGATFAGIIEEGASYASIRAEVIGQRAPFSRVHPIFRLLHGAPLDVQGRSDGMLYMHEWELPQEDIVIRYVIPQEDAANNISGDGYVGMAHAFRAFLQERYPWMQNRIGAPGGNEPVYAMVEILGAALTPQHILGFPVDRSYPFTTYDGAASMMETLHGMGWRNLHVKMRGAHNESIDHNVPTSLDLISQLGGRRGFNNMVNTAERLGFEFYLEADFLRMRGIKMFDGFSAFRDAARQANRERVAHAGYSPIYFGPLGTGAIMADPIILARPEFMINTAQNFVNEAERRGVNNMAFRSMASALSGDFNEDRHVTREASMNMRTDFLRGIRDNGTGVWLNYGFSYGAPFADVITNMPLSDQGFGVVDVAVPFYQIALHGIVPFAGRPLNLAEDNRYNLLKSIESGASLFFSFMDVPTSEINVTRYRRYFANEFSRWQNEADRLYQNHANIFGNLQGQFIIHHDILHRDGITVTVYENGTRIYVNTTLMDFVTPSGVTVEAMSYAVR
jgi:hypothetical protein